MGGRIRLLVVGSAPLSGTVLTFVRCALGCVVRYIVKDVFWFLINKENNINIIHYFLMQRLWKATARPNVLLLAH